MARRSLLVVVALALTAGAAGAAEDEAAAKRHFDAGQRAFDEGDYPLAVREFEQAYEQKPHPDALLSLAVACERLYRPRQARTYYERYLAGAAAAAPQRALAIYRLRVLRTLPGSILVETDPRGATARLFAAGGGGALASEGTPARFEELAPGRYRVRVELAGHAPAEVTLTLDPGARDMVNLPLKHLTETLTVVSRPEGARVFLDDRELGQTPFAQPVEVGHRLLRLELEDFPPHEESLEIVAGQPHKKSVLFKRPIRSGRSELVLAAMLYGGFGSVAIAEAAGGANLGGLARLGVDLGAAVGGVGIGLLIAAFTTTDYLKGGHSAMMIGTTVWGGALAAGISLGLRLSDRNLIAATLLGSGIGLASGILVARFRDPSPGDAALVNTGGTWGAALGLLAAQSVRFPVTEDRRPWFGWLSFAGCAAGLLAGSLAAWRLDVSRGRVAIVDAFALAGIALGFSIGFGVATPERDEASDPVRLEGGARYGLGGLAVGLLVGAVMARRYQSGLAPASALLSRQSGRVALGVPQLRFASRLGPAGPDTRVTIDLAAGTF